MRRTRWSSPAPEGFSLVELLVTIALIAVLVSLLLPAVQSAREASRRTRCQNNLRQVGIALHMFHDRQGNFPKGCVEWRPQNGTTQRQLAWSAYLLPDLEQQNLYDAIDFSQAFDAPVNSSAAATTVRTYVCPSSLARELNPNQVRGASDYGGMSGERLSGTPNYPEKGMLMHFVTVRFSNVTDGTAQTLIVTEDSRSPDGEWINGRNVFDQAFAINAAPSWENDIRSEHPGGANAVAVDGSVHFLAENMADDLLAALCTRAGAEVVEDWP